MLVVERQPAVSALSSKNQRCIFATTIVVFLRWTGEEQLMEDTRRRLAILRILITLPEGFLLPQGSTLQPSPGLRLNIHAAIERSCGSHYPTEPKNRAGSIIHSLAEQVANGPEGGQRALRATTKAGCVQRKMVPDKKTTAPERSAAPWMRSASTTVVAIGSR